MGLRGTSVGEAGDCLGLRGTSVGEAGDCLGLRRASVGEAGDCLGLRRAGDCLTCIKGLNPTQPQALQEGQRFIGHNVNNVNK